MVMPERIRDPCDVTKVIVSSIMGNSSIGYIMSSINSKFYRFLSGFMGLSRKIEQKLCYLRTCTNVLILKVYH